MAKVAKLPSSFPPNGQTPLVHGAKVEIASLCSGKVMIMEQNGALRANFSSANGRCFVVSQLGSAVMLQCPQTGNFIAANAGYLYGFGANQQQAALRVYYHEDSGAIEFESAADPGKFLAFDRVGNVIPLTGTSNTLNRQFAVRVLEEKASVEAPRGSLNSLISMGKKMASKVVGEGQTQVNFEKNSLRQYLTHGGRVRLRSKTTGKCLAMMANGIVHGNGGDDEFLTVHHCFGLMRYSFQSVKFPMLWLCVTLDNITWAMHNRNMTKENPTMVWEVDKCRSDGRILLRRNTQVSNGTIHQFLGFAPNGKPTPSLIHPGQLGDLIVETATARVGTVPAPVQLHAASSPAVPLGGMPSGGPVGLPVGAPSAPADLPPPPPMGIAPEGLYQMPPGAMLYDGALLHMKNSDGYLAGPGTVPEKCKDTEWEVNNAGFMVFAFKNPTNGKFLNARGKAIDLGKQEESSNFQVRFNPNGSVSFLSVASEGVALGGHNSEMLLELV